MANEDDEDDDPIIEIAKALAQNQGSTQALYHIMLELFTQITFAQPDPSQFVKKMYEAISAKLDQTPPETAAKIAHGHELDTISTFFSVVERRVRKRRGGKGDTSPQG
jgi:hypothetical protein